MCGSRKDVIRPEDFTVHYRDIEQKQLKGCNPGEDKNPHGAASYTLNKQYTSVCIS